LRALRVFLLPGMKRKASKPKMKPTVQSITSAPILLSGGNPQIAKGEGDAPVQAYIAALPPAKRSLAAQLDRAIVRAVPGVKKAVKWNSPFYGIEGRGWFLVMHAFTKYMKVTFFRGTSLEPPPPIESKVAEVRSLHIDESSVFDEDQFTRWVKHASTLPGGEGLGPC
jgi:hypothetical protein